jgi:iron(III) transport system ATP-binding protein
MNPTAFLDLRHIRKEFGGFTALADINLEIGRGDFVCFLGPSGCGKTTLLRIIAGLEVQTRGQILQNGRDISLLPPALRDYGIVFQSYACFPISAWPTTWPMAWSIARRRAPKSGSA